MVELGQFCEDVMGEPPCQYAIVGMGSLAREEITPYSDFEHIILLFDDKNYESYLEYFKLFSVIFHVIVLNVQETFVPSLNIYSLNDKTSALGDWYYDAVTPRGISFDGMMPHACKFPLGRQQHTTNKAFTTELIKPVSEMLEYLRSEVDLKHGYHLADILTKTCFVFGNEDIYNQFLNGANKYSDIKSQTDNIFHIKQQVKDDLDNFSTRFRLTNLKSQDKINIKQLVYRSTTLFISALGRKHNISANSSFDTVNEMAKHNKITQNTADKLRNAIAIACEIRLRVYVNNKSQCDNAIDLTHDGIEKFLEIVGVASTLNYFQIAYCLQCELAKQLNFTKLHFYSNPQLINITIGLAFGLRNLPLFSKNSENGLWDIGNFDFDSCIQKLENEIKYHYRTEMKTTLSLHFFTGMNADQIKSVVKHLTSAHVFDEALDFCKQLLCIYNSKSIDRDHDYDVAWVNNQIGYCLDHTFRGKEALTYYARALDIKQNITRNAKTDAQISLTLENIGCCHLKLQNHEKALEHLNQALKINQNKSLNADLDRSIGKKLYSLARCHIDMHNYEEALANLNRTLEINLKTSRNVTADKNIASTLHTIGRCQLAMHNFNEALATLNQTLEIKQKTTYNAERSRNISATLDEIGHCHTDLRNYDEALTHLKRSLEINTNTTLDLDKDRSVAVTKSKIGRCLTKLHNYSESWNCLEQSLKVFQDTTLNEKKDNKIAETLTYMGECMIAKEQYVEALAYLQRSREIYQSQTNAGKDGRLALIVYCISMCCMNLQEYADALSCLKQARNVYRKFPPNKHITKKLASISSNIDECILKLVR